MLETIKFFLQYTELAMIGLGLLALYLLAVKFVTKKELTEYEKRLIQIESKVAKLEESYKFFMDKINDLNKLEKTAERLILKINTLEAGYDYFIKQTKVIVELEKSITRMNALQVEHNKKIDKVDDRVEKIYDELFSKSQIKRKKPI